MNVIEEALKILQEEYRAGATHEELSRKYGISSNHISNILSGKRSIDSMRVGTFLKIFPHMTLNLHGDSINNSGTNHGVVGVNNGTVSSDCLSAVENKILSTDDLTAEEKVKVLKVLKK